MRVLLFSLVLTLGACSGGGESCETDAATRCLENAAETCTGGAWELTDDCAAGGQTCMQDDAMMAGAAHCM